MGTENLTENMRPIKKLDGALFIFILLVAFTFDIIGLIPFVSSFMFLLFLLLVRVQLSLAGYHAGIIRMVVVFLLNFAVDFIFSLWFACTVFTISFYFFNALAYRNQQKLLDSEEHELV